MSYQVLARKWRPRVFREMVGQEHVLKALINALDNNRLHHAYLFTGTRGVGKTTIARILAKCLNCEQGVSSEPCGQCASCTEIAEGRCVDLLEVDAASRTKVEDTRELLDNVQYVPTRARYKVYLIDEVHMLSGHSFNALLKTLEEPPEHVKFLLATTDPQKLPATVLSRCLQFNLKNMSPEQVVNHLAKLLEQEQIDAEEGALWLLGRAAAGSMRDALSLTDQAIAFGSGKVRETDVRSMLGSVDLQFVYELLETVANGEAATCLDVVARMAEHAPDFEATLDEMISVLHRVAVAQAIPAAVDNSFGDAERVTSLAKSISAEDCQLFYQMALNGKRDLALAADPRSGFEMLLLRMLAFRPAYVIDDGVTPEQLRSDSTESSPQRAASPAPREEEGANREKKSPEPAAGLSTAEPKTPGQLTLDNLNGGSWPEHFHALGLNGILHNIASHCAFAGKQGLQLDFVLDESNASLYSDRQRENLQAALKNFYAEDLSLRIDTGIPAAETPAKMIARQQAERQAEAERSLESDLTLKRFIQRFDGELDRSSISPCDN